MGDLPRHPNLEEQACDRFLGVQSLCLDEYSIPWILNHSDSFVSQSRGNETVEHVLFYPYFPSGGLGNDDDVWDKIGQAIGNLQALDRILICSEKFLDADDDDKKVGPILNWETVACVLSHVRQDITLNVTPVTKWRAEDSRSFARAIHGHPTIRSFVGGSMFPFEASDALYSPLSTLPALESVEISNVELHALSEDEYAPESLTELLRVPTLRSVTFRGYHFTRALCQATAKTVTKGTAISNLTFFGCSFSARRCTAIMTNALSRNTSVTSITIHCDSARALFDALAAALPSNSTLRHLELAQMDNDDPDSLPPVLLALGKNTGLKTLKVDVHGSMEESLCTALKDGLGMNETLQNLEVSYYVPLLDENRALWNRAFSFLRTNKALKSLVINSQHGVTESSPAAFCSDIAAMLQENASLESLSIRNSWNAIKIPKAEEYLLLVTALQHNTTLKTFSIYRNGSLRLTDDEDKQMAALLKKNYAMEHLPDINVKDELGDVNAILQLNRSGRRYLIQDGSSISKGVEVLSAVRSEINCVFFHLLENPRLCDRSAVEAASDVTEAASDGTDDGGSTSPVNQTIGKRDHGLAPNEGKESRRRLT